MSKKDWKKQLLRMKQIADQNLGRSEKSEVLTDDLQLLERQINQIKDAWQSIIKKLQACLGTHTGEAEKRLKKLPEYAFTNCLSDLASTFNIETAIGKTFSLCSEGQLSLAKNLVQYGIDIETKVVQPAQILLEKDIPAILKLRKQLTNMTLDMDAAKSKYHALSKQSQNAPNNSRLDAAREEMEAAEAKVEHCKDAFATEMYSFFAREDELCRMFVLLLESQSLYHRQSLEALDRLIPIMKDDIEMLATRPVFGYSLEDHLCQTNREIASVIEDCVVAIMRRGLDVEGIFRIAPAASKLKKLKAAFDANMVDMDEFDNDIHCFCGALKHYLRELPQPLMTFELYEEWMQASQRPLDQRLNALWVVVDKLPKHNYNNLRYLIKFLSKVTEHSEFNKMTSSNLAIVFGPNLLWAPGDNRSDIHITGSLTSIVEILIGSSEWFFPGDIDFPTSDFVSPSSIALPQASYSDSASQPLHAKMAFLSKDNGNGDQTTMKTSSSINNLLEPNTGSDTSSHMTSASYGTLRPQRKVKKAAPAPPVPSGNHHHRSSSVTILPSNIQDIMRFSESHMDDVDRRVSVAIFPTSRPKVPPPARPTGLPHHEKMPPPPPPPVGFRSVKTDLDERFVDNVDQTYPCEENSSARASSIVTNVPVLLDVPSGFAKKPGSKSLDDVVSESSRLTETHRSLSGNVLNESKGISDSGDVYHHQRTPDSSSSDLTSDLNTSHSGGIEVKLQSSVPAEFGTDVPVVAECMESLLLKDYNQSVTFTDENTHKMSVENLDSEKLNRIKEETKRKSPAMMETKIKSPTFYESRLGESRAIWVEEIVENPGPQTFAPVLSPVLPHFDLAVLPPTPEASGIHNTEIPRELEPPYNDDVENSHSHDKAPEEVDVAGKTLPVSSELSLERVDSADKNISQTKVSSLSEEESFFDRSCEHHIKSSEFQLEDIQRKSNVGDSQKQLDNFQQQLHKEEGIKADHSSSTVTKTKPSDHSEMVQSLKLFFLSSNPPAEQRVSVQEKSQSDVDLSQQIPSKPRFSTYSEDAGSLRGVESSSSISNLVTASKVNQYRSSSDISERSEGASMQSEKASAHSTNLSRPVSYHHPYSEAIAESGVVRAMKPSAPPPPPARRTRLNDSSAPGARGLDSRSSKILEEDTRL